MVLSGAGISSWALIVAALLPGGFAYGGSSISYSAGIKNAFGPRHYTQNFALSQLAMGVAALFESASGEVYDLFGSYLSVGVMMLIFAAIALVMAFPGLKFFKPQYESPANLLPRKLR